MHDLILRRDRSLEHARVPPQPENGDPVGHLEDVLQVVGDDDDREALGCESLDEGEHLCALDDAERSRGLVEDEDA